MRPTLFTLLVATLLLAGCDSKPVDPRAKPGLLIGKLSDAAGKPLKNVTITIAGFTFNNEPVNKSVTIQGPAGEYSIPLPEGTYSAPTAQIAVEYSQLSYVLPVAPVDDLREWPEARDSRKGLVRDFVWKISGTKPGMVENSTNPRDFWGGTIHFDKCPGQGFGDSAKFEITLAPDGPLIDGSQGKPLTFTRQYPWNSRDDHLLLNIPLGRYIATVKHLYGTRPKPLRIICHTVDRTNPDISPDKTATKVPVDFETHRNSDGVYELMMPNLVVFPSS